ncbi:MAG: hypothetical protein IJG84_11750 [Kiritimatiellae bacterium]|nr:hypothetical protein [Kiritimatiellia bacterium]
MSMHPVKMPISRDISVKRPAVSGDDGPSVLESKAAPSLVTVIGFDKSDVLFRSDKVGTVQWRDSKGEIVALLVRMKPDVWGFSRRGDNDWQEVLGIYGNPDAT